MDSIDTPAVNRFRENVLQDLHGDNYLFKDHCRSGASNSRGALD